MRDSDAEDPASFTPADSPMTIEDVIAAPEYLDLMTPEVAAGEPAPDFALRRLDRPEEIVRLGDFAGHRPVALIFGSYT